MRQVAKKGLLTAVGTASVLASTAGYAYASAEAHGGTANSPGVGSGNSVQVPVDAPINACGNTVNVVGLLNPAMGNNCGNSSAHTRSGASADGGAHGSPGVASGNSVQVPITAPVNACGNSVNVVGAGNPAFGNHCGNDSAHTPAPPACPGDEACPPGDHTPPPGGDTPPTSTQPGGGTTRGGSGNGDQTPPVTSSTGGTAVTGVADKTAPAAAIPSQSAPAIASAASGSQLAHTGATGLELLAPAGAALLLAGGVLYRRSRVGAGAR